MTATITKAAFNAAVQSAVANVRPKLLDLEAKLTELGLIPTHPVSSAIIELHAALAAELANADALGDAGGVHTNSGGTGKGDAE